MKKVYFVLAMDENDMEAIKESMSIAHDHEFLTDEDVIEQFVNSRDINEVADVHDHLEFVEVVYMPPKLLGHRIYVSYKKRED